MMYFVGCRLVMRCSLGLLVLSLLVGAANAAPPGNSRPSRQFRPGNVTRLEDIPQGRLRSRLDALPPAARQRGLDWLNRFHFTDHDLDTLQADDEGAIFYADDFVMDPGPESAETSQTSGSPQMSEAAVPVTPFPSGLIFHSKPGSVNILFLNFAGDTFTGTAWNSSLGRPELVAVAFSKDSDYSTFSDAEQVIIKRVWQRVAEDYGPFDIDVTTERPASFDSHTAQAIITRNTDADDMPNPSSSAGGVAYIDVFGGNMSYYNPAWIYFNNLSSDESFIGEAASHEAGHMMGLSHDGTTDGSSYYSGHGSGDTSWGPIMGTGYNRNVSQWSKGEYYHANNSQDDLNTIAGKLSYRVDDHGGTHGTATPIEISGTGEIVSTTPEDDPQNNSPENKGILERNDDVDCFSFVTGAGLVTLTVNPWIVSSARTRGGNLDVLLELEDSDGAVLATNNLASQTLAEIQLNLAEGLYFLKVRNTGTGTPESASPSGYTSYGSVGQYFISGSVVPSSYSPLPVAELQVADLTATGQSAIEFNVTYSDDMGIDVATLDDADLVVTGPNGYTAAAQFVSVDVTGNGTPRVATYQISPPDGLMQWSASANGDYSVWIQSNQVSDVEGASVESELLGTFVVNVPVTLYSANMDADPIWSMESLWGYGPPDYSGGNAPSSAGTGTNIVAYNLSGNYQNSLSPKYATSPIIDARGYSDLLLSFKQWLRVRNGDIARIQLTTNGVDWSDLWASSGTVSDTSWQIQQFNVPELASGSDSLQVRWSIESGPSQSDIGWNIDDVELLGSATSTTTNTVTLVVNVNNPLWGQVTPMSNSYPAGTVVEVTATPEQYFSLANWTGDLSSTTNPLTVSLDTDLELDAVFAEIVTTNHTTPYWWLALQGVSSNFEMAEEDLGGNGVPLWQSFVAGLDPTDPTSRFLVTAETAGNGSQCVLKWDPVPGRVYTVLSSSDSNGGFSPVPGAAGLPDSIQSYTNVTSPNLPIQFYRLEVSLP